MSHQFSDAISNVNKIFEFQKYEEEGLKPKLAVLNGRLVIYSKESKTMGEKIAAFFQGVINQILLGFGLLSTDPEKVKELVDAANRFYLEKAEKLNSKLTSEISQKSEELQRIEKLIPTLIKVFDEESEQLNDTLSKKTADLQLLETNAIRQQALLEEIEGQQQNLQKIISDLTQNTSLLERKEASLKAQIEDIEPKATEIKQLKETIESLKHEVTALKNERNQLQYKDRCEKLEKDMSTLKQQHASELHHEREEGKREGMSAGYASGFSTGLAAGHH